MQNAKIKMQNDKSKFKKDFIKRLIGFAVKVLKFAEKGRSKRIFCSLLDQLIRSSTSLGANIIEARASSSKKDYIHYFEIALKSANETLYWLILLRETIPEFKKEIEGLYTEADEIAKVLASSVLTLNLKGKK